MKSYDVVIVGGGVVGSASAYYLRKQGFKGSIALVEKDTSWALGCTARSVGGLRQQFSTPENIALSKFGVALVKTLKDEFRVDRYVAEGGFGVVYRAEQENPRRTVAVKVIKPHLATPSMLRRFEHEAQLLGRLQHPGIAQIYEAGVVERPGVAAGGPSAGAEKEKE